ncbi:MAG: hypothetical protein HFH74_16010 [Lachnospiraceae bacterium]|jgi:hypothetical protein|nr:hypothetical protein [Lachnospiraceae bacterium]
MNYLWDIALRARQQGIDEKDLFFVQAQDYSPFYEQAFPCINETSINDNVIELNLLYRFAEVFQEILAPDIQEMPDLNRYLIDAALHIILYIELHHGIGKRDIYILRLLYELRQGSYWQEAAQHLKAVPQKDWHRVAALLLGQIQTGSSLKKFRRGLYVIYPDAVLYQIKKDSKKLLLYLKEKKTRENEEKLLLIKDLFMPVGYDLRVFWKYHFGIVGVNDAMRFEETAVY